MRFDLVHAPGRTRQLLRISHSRPVALPARSRAKSREQAAKPKGAMALAFSASAHWMKAWFRWPVSPAHCRVRARIAMIETYHRIQPPLGPKSE